MSRSPHLPLDAYARTCIAQAPHSIIAWWLMASYLYYQTDECLLTDGFFDEISRDMLVRWDQIEHPHKHLIDRDGLAAGTGFHIPAGGYPMIVVDAAIMLAEEGPPAEAGGDHKPARGEPSPRRGEPEPLQGDLF